MFKVFLVFNLYFSVVPSSTLRMNYNDIENAEDFNSQELGDGVIGSEVESVLGIWNIL